MTAVGPNSTLLGTESSNSVENYIEMTQCQNHVVVKASATFPLNIRPYVATQSNKFPFVCEQYTRDDLNKNSKNNLNRDVPSYEKKQKQQYMIVSNKELEQHFSTPITPPTQSENIMCASEIHSLPVKDVGVTVITTIIDPFLALLPHYYLAEEQNECCLPNTEKVNSSSTTTTATTKIDEQQAVIIQKNSKLSESKGYEDLTKTAVIFGTSQQSNDSYNRSVINDDYKNIVVGGKDMTVVKSQSGSEYFCETVLENSIPKSEDVIVRIEPKKSKSDLLAVKEAETTSAKEIEVINDNMTSGSAIVGGNTKHMMNAKIRRQRFKKSENESEDPIERLNKLRAKISGALSEVKGVLKQYSTDQSVDIADESVIGSNELKSDRTELSASNDDAPVRFRFVRKIRRRSHFSEDDEDQSLLKKVTESEANLELPNVNNISTSDKENKQFTDNISSISTQNGKKTNNLELKNVGTENHKIDTADDDIKSNKNNDEPIITTVSAPKKEEQNDDQSNKTFLAPSLEALATDSTNDAIDNFKIQETSENERKVASINILQVTQVINSAVDAKLLNEINTNNDTTENNLIDKKIDPTVAKSNVKTKKKIVIKRAVRRASIATVEATTIDPTVKSSLPLNLKAERRPSDSEAIVKKKIITNNEQQTAPKVKIITKVKRATVKSVATSTAANLMPPAAVPSTIVSTEANGADSVPPKKTTATTTEIIINDATKIERVETESEVIGENHAAKKSFKDNNQTDQLSQSIVIADGDRTLKADLSAFTSKIETPPDSVDAADITGNIVGLKPSDPSLSSLVTTLSGQQENKLEVSRNTEADIKGTDDGAKLQLITANLKTDQEPRKVIEVSDTKRSTTNSTNSNNKITLTKLTPISIRASPSRQSISSVVEKMPELAFTPLQIFTDAKLKNLSLLKPFTQHKNDLVSKKNLVKSPLVKTNSTEKSPTKLDNFTESVPQQVLEKRDSTERKDEKNDQIVNAIEDGDKATEAETPTESTESPKPEKKKRKVKKKVIIRRLKRKLSGGDPFFKTSEEESLAADVVEKPIEYVKEDGVEDDIENADPAELPKPWKSCLKIREYQVGDIVMYADRYKKTQVRWKKAKVIDRITSISYKLDINGEEKAAHISYIKKFTGRNVNFGGKEYLEIDYEQIAEEEEKARNYSIWNMV